MTKSFHSDTGCQTNCAECNVIYVTNDKTNTEADYYINMTDHEFKDINSIGRFHIYLQPIPIKYFSSKP